MRYRETLGPQKREDPAQGEVKEILRMVVKGDPSEAALHQAMGPQVCLRSERQDSKDAYTQRCHPHAFCNDSLFNPRRVGMQLAHCSVAFHLFKEIT